MTGSLSVSAFWAKVLGSLAVAGIMASASAALATYVEVQDLTRRIDTLEHRGAAPLEARLRAVETGLGRIEAKMGILLDAQRGDR